MGNYNKNLELLKDGSKESLNKFAELNFPLVLSISKKFLNRGYEYEEIFQVGCLGLTRAMKKFSFDYNVSFSTYAVPMIMWEIRRFLRDNAAIKVSRNLKTLFYKIYYGKTELSNTLNREPTTQELSKYLNVAEKEIKDAGIMFHTINADSLDRVIHSPHKEGSDITVGDNIANNFNLEESAIQNIDLQNAMNTLPTMQKQVINLKIQDYTQIQTAKILDISQVQVSRLEKKALRKLKEYLRSDNLSKKDDAIELFKQGFTTKEVMGKLNITKNTATTYKSYYNKQNNIPSKKAEAFKMFSQRFKNPAIETKLGLTQSTVTTYRHEFAVIKGKVFTRLTTGKSESEISRELKIGESLVHNLRQQWASIPLKPENVISTGETVTKIKSIEEETKKKVKPQKPIEITKKPVKKLENHVIEQPTEIKKENKEEKYMSLKPLLLKGEFAKYDLQEEGKVKVICDKEVSLNPDQIDLFVQELQQAKKVI